MVAVKWLLVKAISFPSSTKWVKTLDTFGLKIGIGFRIGSRFRTGTGHCRIRSGCCTWSIHRRNCSNSFIDFCIFLSLSLSLANRKYFGFASCLLGIMVGIKPPTKSKFLDIFEEVCRSSCKVRPYPQERLRVAENDESEDWISFQVFIWEPEPNCDGHESCRGFSLFLWDKNIPIGAYVAVGQQESFDCPRHLSQIVQ